MTTSTAELAKKAGAQLTSIFGAYVVGLEQLETFRALIAHDATVAAMEKCAGIAGKSHGHKIARFIAAEIRAEIPLPPENKP